MDISGKFNVTFNIYQVSITGTTITGNQETRILIAENQSGYLNSDLFKFGIALPEFSNLDATKYSWLFTKTTVALAEGLRVHISGGDNYEAIGVINVANKYLKVFLRKL